MTLSESNAASLVSPAAEPADGCLPSPTDSHSSSIVTASNPIITPNKNPASASFRIATQCCFVSDTGVRDPYGASATPIYQTATFKQSSVSDMGEYDYTRSGNPTRSNLGMYCTKWTEYGWKDGVLGPSKLKIWTLMGMATLIMLTSWGAALIVSNTLNIASSHRGKAHFLTLLGRRRMIPSITSVDS